MTGALLAVAWFVLGAAFAESLENLAGEPMPCARHTTLAILLWPILVLWLLWRGLAGTLRSDLRARSRQRKG